MKVAETVTTEVKLKKKCKKKKSSKLNNNDEKLTENGVADTEENLLEKLDELCIGKQKNGLELVNGIEKHCQESEKEKHTSEAGANCGGGNDSNKKVGSKKKKNKKQKEPDKVLGPSLSEILKSEPVLETTDSTTTTKQVTLEAPVLATPKIHYKEYESELQMPDIMQLIQKDLSEPYSIYTYRYFIHNWPKLCFLAMHESKCVGAIVCKLDMHKMIRRGYIAMLAVDKDYRKLKIGTTLVQKAIEVKIFACAITNKSLYIFILQAMLRDSADEVVLETEITNRPALKLYENLGFVRDKRLFHYYLNGVDALRLKLWPQNNHCVDETKYF